jgi:hypothetical protein
MLYFAAQWRLSSPAGWLQVIKKNVSDPLHLNADPDPAYHVEADSDPNPAYLLGLLGVELTMAPLGPLMKCPLLVVLHISILTPVSFPPLCGRNQTLSVVFKAEFETPHCFCIFTSLGIRFFHVTNFNHNGIGTRNMMKTEIFMFIFRAFPLMIKYVIIEMPAFFGQIRIQIYELLKCRYASSIRQMIRSHSDPDPQNCIRNRSRNYFESPCRYRTTFENNCTGTGYLLSLKDSDEFCTEFLKFLNTVTI